MNSPALKERLCPCCNTIHYSTKSRYCSDECLAELHRVNGQAQLSDGSHYRNCKYDDFDGTIDDEDLDGIIYVNSRMSVDRMMQIAGDGRIAPVERRRRS